MKMTKEEFIEHGREMENKCVNSGYYHNQGTRYTHGFHCEDCDTFFPKESEEYIRTKEFFLFEFWIHNIGVHYGRLNIKKPKELRDLEREYKRLNNIGCYKITLSEISEIGDRIMDLQEEINEN